MADTEDKTVRTVTVSAVQVSAMRIVITPPDSIRTNTADSSACLEHYTIVLDGLK